MSLLTKARKAVTEPFKLTREIHRSYWRFRALDGIHVVSEDWDNLIVLDACRYDLFEERNDISGELSKITSSGSMTTEWMEHNFEGGRFPEIVFVSGNPNLESVAAEFAEVIRLWKRDWNEEFGTAHPEAMVDATLDAAERNPNKRLISMFVQPHAPFIGPKGRQFNQRGFTGGGIIKETDKQPIWHQLGNGKIDKDDLWTAYKENFELTLPYVETLVNELEGKTVVTSDHGNAFGEMGIYGHPKGVYIPELVEVPWLSIDTGTRKKIIPTDTLESTRSTDDQELNSRLEDLGYM